MDTDYRRQEMLHTSSGHNAIRSRRSEIELILACCRSPRGASPDGAVLQIMNSGINWELLLKLMDFHRVTLVVGSQLFVVGTSRVPESVLEQVRYSQCAATKKNLAQIAELVRILRLLQENGLQVIPFKGPVLATYLYGDLSLRESSDIDLIVQQQDVLNIRRVLASIGYVPCSRLSSAQEAALIRSACVHELHNRGKSCHLELHWKTSKHPSLPLPVDFAWTGQQEISVGGMQIKTLLPEALLLLLCAHGTKHSWQRLRYVCDIADTMRVAENIDWEGILRGAARIGALGMVFAGLSLANGLLAAPVPDEILREIRKNPKIQRIAAERSEEIFHSSREEPGYWNIFRFNLRSLDNWHVRLRYLARILLRPGAEDFETARLPRFLYPLYPFIRLFRLCGQLGLRANSSAASQCIRCP